ncbi:hypothetical protein J6590_104817 [Homalodisca vitripennis]|nr:hypothetical protein J6590_104817 [Homalodisca vitripennis]
MAEVEENRTNRSKTGGAQQNRLHKQITAMFIMEKTLSTELKTLLFRDHAEPIDRQPGGTPGQACKTGTVPAKPGRMASLRITNTIKYQSRFAGAVQLLMIQQSSPFLRVLAWKAFLRIKL